MVRNKGKIALAGLCFNILTGVTTYAKELTLEELINVVVKQNGNTMIQRN